MNDRELLENAAKAVGINWVRVDDVWYDKETGRAHNWNPLTDDGDALRLAVKLRIHVSIFADAIGIGTPSRGYEETKWSDDPYTATRRAIVRSAAEIGKNAA